MIKQAWVDSNNRPLTVGDDYLVFTKNGDEFVGKLRSMDHQQGQFWFTWLRLGIEKFLPPQAIDEIHHVEGGWEWLGV